MVTMKMTGPGPSPPPGRSCLIPAGDRGMLFLPWRGCSLSLGQARVGCFSGRNGMILTKECSSGRAVSWAPADVKSLTANLKYKEGLM